MNLPLLLGAITDYLNIIGAAVAILFVVFLFLGIWASRYTKVGPNQVLVISGRKHRMLDPDGTMHEVGFRIVKGGGVFVWPVFEKVDVLSLELLTIDVQTPEVYTSKGVPVKVDGVAQIKVKGDDISIATAPSSSWARPPTRSATSPPRLSKAICGPSWAP
jgi:flotillin